MGACFWQDMVRCSEDCVSGSATSSAGEIIWGNSTKSSTAVQLVDGAGTQFCVSPGQNAPINSSYPAITVENFEVRWDTDYNGCDITPQNAPPPAWFPTDWICGVPSITTVAHVTKGMGVAYSALPSASDPTMYEIDLDALFQTVGTTLANELAAFGGPSSNAYVIVLGVNAGGNLYYGAAEFNTCV